MRTVATKDPVVEDTSHGISMPTSETTFLASAVDGAESEA